MLQIVVQTVNIVLIFFEKLNTLGSFKLVGTLSRSTVAI